MAERTPTVGDIVLVTVDGKDRAALVTAPVGGRRGIAVTVFYPDRQPEQRTDVAQAAARRTDGTWHWPQRADAGGGDRQC